MKSCARSLLLALLAATSAAAGPNAGGVLVVHSASLTYTGDSQSYNGLSGVACGQDGPIPDSVQVCPPYDPTDGVIPCVTYAGNPTSTVPDAAGQVWYVLAAFDEFSCPRLKAAVFAIDYSSTLTVAASGPAGDDPSRIFTVLMSSPAGAAWPASKSAVALSYSRTRTSLVQELYWFAGYAYGPATFSIVAPDPILPQQLSMADDATPRNVDIPRGLGIVGFRGSQGYNPGVFEDPVPITSACCLQDGLCEIRQAIDCPGLWGLGLCSPNPCVQDGACCSADGTCAVLMQAQCTGVWHGESPTCTPNPCPQPGACCATDGSCAVHLETQCSGTWEGSGSLCQPNPCPQPGACCNLEAGSCVLLPATACDLASYPHSYAGDGTTCTPNPCPAPSGACCFGDGSCIFMSSAACAREGGSFRGNLVPCAPNPCPQPVGACCVNLVCTSTTQNACVAPGVWHGAGTVCVPNPCGSNPPGSCCAPDGSCALTVHVACAGDWTMGGSCTPNICPSPPGGACCAADGTCTLETQFSCAAPSDWQGGGTACTPNPCPLPTGACCAMDGACAETLQAACTGVWTMFAVCTPNPCAFPQGVCCQPDGACTITFESGCVAPAIWHLDLAACAPNPCPQPTGACCVAAGSCTVTLQVACAADWTAFGVCAPNPCPQPPLGACCALDATCVLSSEFDCPAASTWRADLLSCEPNLCPLLPTRSTSWGRIKNDYR